MSSPNTTQNNRSKKETEQIFSLSHHLVHIFLEFQLLSLDSVFFQSFLTVASGEASQGTVYKVTSNRLLDIHVNFFT